MADLIQNDKFYKLKYQPDAVTDGFRKLRQHSGFFLADVVGLGKTIVGTLIAKRFCQFARSAAHTPRVLIIAPPTLVKNWEEATKDFALQRFGAYGILRNGSWHKLRHDPEDYDLIIVDEAHKFRNDTAGAYGQRLLAAPGPAGWSVFRQAGCGMAAARVGAPLAVLAEGWVKEGRSEASGEPSSARVGPEAGARALRASREPREALSGASPSK